MHRFSGNRTTFKSVPHGIEWRGRMRATHGPSKQVAHALLERADAAIIEARTFCTRATPTLSGRLGRSSMPTGLLNASETVTPVRDGCRPSVNKRRTWSQVAENAALCPDLASP